MRLVRAMSLAVVAAVAPAAIGCATMSDVVDEHREGGGVAMDYDVDPPTAFAIAREVFRDAGAEAVEDHPEDWSMRATLGATLFHYGTLMAAWISVVGPTRVRVTVVTKRKMSTNIVTGLSESEFHEKFRERLVIALEARRRAWMAAQPPPGPPSSALPPAPPPPPPPR